MGMITGVLLAVLSVPVAILISVVSKLLADDFKAWSPRIVDWLIRRAVNKLPEDHRERLDEEWRSHINDTPGDLWKPIAACGFLRAARIIAPRVSRNPSLVDLVRLAGMALMRFIEFLLAFVVLPIALAYGLYMLTLPASTWLREFWASDPSATLAQTIINSRIAGAALTIYAGTPLLLALTTKRFGTDWPARKVLRWFVSLVDWTMNIGMVSTGACLTLACLLLGIEALMIPQNLAHGLFGVDWLPGWIIRSLGALSAGGALGVIGAGGWKTFQALRRYVHT